MTDHTELINSLRTALTRKESCLLTLEGTTSELNLELGRHFIMNENIDYEVALIRFEAYNTIYNITASNNLFYYFNGKDNRIITFPPGAYEVKDINNELIRQMKILGDSLTAIIISGSTSLVKGIITITGAYTVDFTQPKTFRSLLGFDSVVLKAGYNLSNNIINIAPINTIYINTNICEGSYNNSKQNQAIYSLGSYSVPVGYKIVKEPAPPIYLPVSKSTTLIQECRVWITDENKKLINFNSENITVVLHIRSV